MNWRQGLGAILVSAVGLGAGGVLAQPGQPVWSQSFGDISQQWIEDVAADASGNAVVVGQYAGTGFDLGGGALPPNSYYYNLYLAKFSATGAHVWSRAIPGIADDDFGYVSYERRLGVDSAGNIYLAGNYYGTPNLGCGPLTVGHGGVFVAKLDTSGACVWSHGYPGAYVDTPRLAVDGSGRVAVAGFFNGTLNFGGGALTSSQHGLFLARLDSAGNHVWSKRFETTGGGVFGEGLGVTLDGGAGVVLTGGFSGYVNLGASSMRSRGGQDLFVARFNGTGGLVWGRRFGDAADQVGFDVTANAAGTPIVTGGFGGVLAIDGVTLTAQSTSDAFLAKLDDTGHAVWGRVFTDPSGEQRGEQVDLDASGRIVTSGRYTDAVNLGSGPLVTPESDKRYVAKFTGTGALLWAQDFSNGIDSFTTRVAAVPGGDVLVGGTYTTDAWLAGEHLIAQGGYGAYDVYLGRYAQ